MLLGLNQCTGVQSMSLEPNRGSLEVVRGSPGLFGVVWGTGYSVIASVRLAAAKTVSGSAPTAIPPIARPDARINSLSRWRMGTGRGRFRYIHADITGCRHRCNKPTGRSGATWRLPDRLSGSIPKVLETGHNWPGGLERGR